MNGINFTGIIIEESLADKSILNDIKITSTRIKEVTEEHKTPWVSQWTMHHVEIPADRASEIAEKISKALDDEHNWYADFKNDKKHFVIYRDKVFYITDRLDGAQYDQAFKYGISIGIPDYQLDFSSDNMKTIKTIRDVDLGQNISAPQVYTERRAARAIVFDSEKKIALLHVTKKSYHKLPGGGIENGEEIKSALQRELLEEIGCAVENICELGIVEEYRNKFELHQISYCFTADLVGEKGQNQLEESEIADGFVPIWVTLEEAIKIMESETGVENYEGKFITERDLTFLKEVK